MSSAPRVSCPFRATFPVTFLLMLGVLVWSSCGGSNKSSSNAPGIAGGGTSGGSGSGSGGTGSGGTGTGTGGTGSGTGGSGSGSGSGTGSGSGGSTGSGSVSVATDVVASGLTVPWSLAFAPDGRLFFTEQPGRLRVIANGQLQSAPVFDVSSQTAGGEAGLTGMTLDPNFASNHYIYIFWCHNGPLPAECDVQRLVEANGTANYDQTLLSFKEANHDHTGGRLKIGPDNMLYLTVGDWDTAAAAQDRTSFAGKILRFALDGTAAPGNPFPDAPYIYALGLRDPQGIAWDSSGQAYGTDNGPTANDEVNIINSGANYGWPNCVGKCGLSQYADPVKLFTGQSVPPSGATFYTGTEIPQWTGSLFFATMGLTGNTAAHHLHRIQFDKPGGTTIVAEDELFKDQFGRLRDVVQGPDGFLYFSTSNGNAADKIIRVRPQ